MIILFSKNSYACNKSWSCYFVNLQLWLFYWSQMSWFELIIEYVRCVICNNFFQVRVCSIGYVSYALLHLWTTNYSTSQPVFCSNPFYQRSNYNSSCSCTVYVWSHPNKLQLLFTWRLCTYSHILCIITLVKHQLFN